ncbi:MAG TPA: hypothetical protein VFV83_10995 [Chthoniobacteraceae bacterium]|nr:hypothetical protein [Chthoniobacteraceae bacterium]
MRSRQPVLLAVLLGVAVAAWFFTRPAVKQTRQNLATPRQENREQSKRGSSFGGVEEPAGKLEIGKSESPRKKETSKAPVAPRAPGAPIFPEIANRSEADPGETTTPAAPPQRTAVTDRQLNEVLDNVRVMIRDYRAVLGENPVGTNAEIMRAINGNNAKQAKIGPPAGQGLNPNGELVDPWGTPFFFHQLSRTEMEIRSAGPDRIMGTADDRQVK